MSLVKFKHSGKLGDLIYALPTIRALGGGVLHINVSGDSIGLAGFNAIRPLLDAQTYISEVRIWEGEAVDLDLDVFRNFDPARRNLIECHFLAAGLQPVTIDDPWLKIDRPRTVSGRPVVFGGARNWMPIPGFWETCYARFGREATLIGLPDEHTRFEREVGPIHFTPTADMLEAAEVIAAPLVSTILRFPHKKDWDRLTLSRSVSVVFVAGAKCSALELLITLSTHETRDRLKAELTVVRVFRGMARTLSFGPR